MSAGAGTKAADRWGAGIDPVVADGLLAVTGRWPLLLRLVNKILANAWARGWTRAQLGCSCWSGYGRAVRLWSMTC